MDNQTMYHLVPPQILSKLPTITRQTTNITWYHHRKWSTCQSNHIHTCTLPKHPCTWTPAMSILTWIHKWRWCYLQACPCRAIWPEPFLSVPPTISFRPCPSSVLPIRWDPTLLTKKFSHRNEKCKLIIIVLKYIHMVFWQKKELTNVYSYQSIMWQFVRIAITYLNLWSLRLNVFLL